MIGLDTSALVDLFRGEESIKKLFSQLDEEAVSTYINYFELMVGIDLKDYAYHEELEFFKNLFEEVKLLSLNKDSCKSSSLIFWEIKKSGEMVGKLDCIIAGVLLANGVNKIITRNIKHFKNIKGLKVISY
jgi:predicted nucleic acid-binding protein